MFGELGPRYSERPGGYTRILKCGYRPGDSALMAFIELVDREPTADELDGDESLDASNASDSPASEASEASDASDEDSQKETLASEEEEAEQKA